MENSIIWSNALPTSGEKSNKKASLAIEAFVAFSIRRGRQRSRESNKMSHRKSNRKSCVTEKMIINHHTMLFNVDTDVEHFTCDECEKRKRRKIKKT